MATNAQSLYGYALLIRNQLRGGGPAVDDDQYPIRIIADQILTAAAKVRQDELYELENRGYTPDVSQMVTVKLKLEDYTGPSISGKPVVLRQTTLPKALTWRGNPAIFGLTTRPDLPGWSVKESSAEAVRMAIAKQYLPAHPAGWLESKSLAIALPVTWSMTRDLYVRFIPADVNIGSDGKAMDVETKALTLTRQQWAKVQPLVMQAMNPMLQTTTNRDTKNDGHDDSAK